MSKVLIVATSRRTHGGITAVVKAHEKGYQWNQFHCYWIQTHRDGSSFIKVLYFLSAFVQFTILLPFFDIVHIHHSLPRSTHRKFYFFKLAKLFGKKTIVHIHCGNQLLNCWNDEYQEIYTKCDFGVALSDNIKKIIESHVGKRDNIKVIFNPCPEIPKETVLNKRKTILFSGTLSKEKGYQDLIRAFAVISKKFPEWKLVFAGNGDINNARKLAIELSIINKCEFLGWITGKDKDSVFRESSIFCLPSYAEGFPMSVLDAWAYGLPVIATPVGGIPDVAKDGENMLIFNPGDVDTLAICLKKMIEDDNLRQRISIESNNFAKTTFSIDSINNQIGELYRELSK